MANDVGVDSNVRHMQLDKGAAKLRSHLSDFAPMKFTLIFEHNERRWEVLAQFLPEGHNPILLGRESLEEFPSPTLIAQAMLLAA